jgi:hypothetical protein
LIAVLGKDCHRYFFSIQNETALDLLTLDMLPGENGNILQFSIARNRRCRLQTGRYAVQHNHAFVAAMTIVWGHMSPRRSCILLPFFPGSRVLHTWVFPFCARPGAPEFQEISKINQPKLVSGAASPPLRMEQQHEAVFKLLRNEHSILVVMFT